MFRDTDGQTDFYCGCIGTRTYTHGICATCGGVEPPPDDLMAEMRGFEEDHEPDGWPAVRMRQISALCDEVERLREQLAAAIAAETKAQDRCADLEDALRPEWDENGEGRTLAAAAEDADEWMALIERLHNNGRGPWKFSDATNLERLRGCRRNLRRCLTPNA